MAFYKDTFGYDEPCKDESATSFDREVDYAAAKKRLLDAAEFEAPPAGSLPDAVERCRLRGVVLGDDGKPQPVLRDAGTFCEPSLAHLRERCPGGRVKEIAHVVGEAAEAHQAALAGGVFQAASQFNFLEFAAPQYTPERGISGYEHDHTQGPVCAMEAAAGTAYRNYLIPPVESKEPWSSVNPATRGQTEAVQRNGLRDAEAYLKAHLLKRGVYPNEAAYVAPWTVTNGYIKANPEALEKVNAILLNTEGGAEVREAVKGCVRFGVQQDTEVTSPGAGRQYAKDASGSWGNRAVAGRPETMRVTQVYCSAIGIDYDRGTPRNVWEPMARLVLEAAYEATMLIGVLDKVAYRRANGGAGAPDRKPADVSLTLLGGGVFGNPHEWISDAMKVARDRVRSGRHNDLADEAGDVSVSVLHYQSVDRSFAPQAPPTDAAIEERIAAMRETLLTLFGAEQGAQEADKHATEQRAKVVKDREAYNAAEQAAAATAEIEAKADAEWAAKKASGAKNA